MTVTSKRVINEILAIGMCINQLSLYPVIAEGTGKLLAIWIDV